MRSFVNPGWLISGDYPRSRILTVVLLAILIALAFAPFLFPGTRSIAVAARICIFIVLAASYDMLLGYTGVVSFAHTMFFGMGAYGVAIALTNMGRGVGRGLVGQRRGRGDGHRGRVGDRPAVAAG